MASGDQSVPVPDLPGYFANATATAKQAEAEMRKLSAAMKQLVREGKPIDAAMTRRFTELEGIKRKSQAAAQQLRDIKGLERQAKLLNSITTSQRLADILGGKKNAAEQAVQLLTDPQVLERASKVIARVAPRLSAGLAGIAPYAGIAALLTEGVIEDIRQRIANDDQIAKTLSNNIDKAREVGLDPSIRREEEALIREAVAQQLAPGGEGDLQEIEKETQERLKKRLERYKLALQAVQELTGLDAQTLKDMGKDPAEEAARALFEGGDQAEAIINEFVKRQRQDRDAAQEFAKKMRSPAFRYQQRETQRQLEIMYQRRRSRVPDTIYD